MRKGRDFELLYEKLYKNLDSESYTITSPAFLKDQITNQQREIDVLIEYTDINQINRRISIECRDRNSIQDVLWIEQLITKKNDLKIDITIATTTSSFSIPAIKKANAYGIVLETAEMIDASYISDITKCKFATFAFIYAKVNYLSFISKNCNQFSKDQFKVHMSNDQLKSFEDFMSINVYNTLDIENMNKEVLKLYKCPFSEAEPFPIDTKLNIENNEEIKIICNNQQISDIYIRYIVQPINYSIPISSGLLTKKPNEFNITNQIAEFNSEEQSSKFSKLGDNFWHELILENKNPYLRFLEATNLAFVPFEINENSIFNLRLTKMQNIFGKLDFSGFW